MNNFRILPIRLDETVVVGLNCDAKRLKTSGNAELLPSESLDDEGKEKQKSGSSLNSNSSAVDAESQSAQLGSHRRFRYWY